jgi:hypothetical protein
VGRFREDPISSRSRSSHPRSCLERDDELAGEPGGFDPTRVEDENEPLVVSGTAARDVGRDQPRGVTECGEDEAKGAQVLARLLDRDDVEARDDLGDAAEVEEIAPWRVAGFGAPLLGDAPEGAQIPGGDEKVAIQLPRREVLMSSPTRRLKVSTRSCGSGSVICGVTAVVLQLSSRPLKTRLTCASAEPSIAENVT